jgi:hypothetical protein
MRVPVLIEMEVRRDAREIQSGQRVQVIGETAVELREVHPQGMGDHRMPMRLPRAIGHGGVLRLGVNPAAAGKASGSPCSMAPKGTH